MGSSPISSTTEVPGHGPEVKAAGPGPDPLRARIVRVAEEPYSGLDGGAAFIRLGAEAFFGTMASDVHAS